MSGQSWSRREAPYGHRTAYVGGSLGSITTSGPGMDIKTKFPARKLTAADRDAEAAALCGFSSVEEYRASGTKSAGPRSTREAGANAGYDVYAGGGVGGAYNPKKRHKRETGVNGASREGWYFVDNSGTEQGPFPRGQMTAWYAAGQILPETKVKRGKFGQFRTAGTSTVLTSMTRDQLRSEVSPDVDRRKNRIYVGNLATSTDKSSLSQLFEEFGALTDVWVPHGDGDKPSRGFGFVSFETAEASAAAIAKMNGHQVDGQKLRVNVANGGKQNSSVSVELESGNDSSCDGLFGGDKVDMGSWVEMFDVGSATTFYWNALTDEKSWELPEGVGERKKRMLQNSKGTDGNALATLGGYGSDSSDA